jgi:hypothetical protein
MAVYRRRRYLTNISSVISSPCFTPIQYSTMSPPPRLAESLPACIAGKMLSISEISRAKKTCTIGRRKKMINKQQQV